MSDAKDPEHLSLILPARLDPGSYGVMWQVLAEDDGHSTTGVIVFSVGVGSAPTRTFAPVTASVSPLDSTLRWMRICLLALIVGGLGMVVLVLGRVRDEAGSLGRSIESAKRRVLITVLAAAAAAAVVAATALVARARDLSGSGLTWDTLGRLVRATRVGHLWVTTEVVFVLIAGVAYAMLRGTRRSARDTDGGLRAGAAALCLALAWIEALGSHASSNAGAGTATFAASIHVLAALLWLGALPALVLALWPRGDERGANAELVRACARPFSGVAVASVVFIVATGMYVAGREVSTADLLIHTVYGRILLIKVGLLCVVGSIGVLNSARLHGWHPTWFGPARRLFVGRAPSHRLIAAEAAVGAVLLLAAAMLADTPPALTNRSSQASPTATQNLYGSIHDLVVSVSITPNRPGFNGFTVVVASSRRPAPAPVEGVALTLSNDLGQGSAPGDVALKEVQPGKYFAAANLAESGAWHLAVVVRRGREGLSIPLGWSVAAVAPPARPEPPERRLAPIADGVAASLLVIAIAIVLIRSVRRRRGRAARHGLAGDPIAAGIDDEIGSGALDDDVVLTGSGPRGEP